MFFGEYMTERFQNNRKSSMDSYIRYILHYSEELKRSVVVELESNKNHELNIKIFDTALPSKPLDYLLDEENAVAIYNELLTSNVDMDEVTPITELETGVVSDQVVVNKIETVKGYQRKGLGSLALHYAMDYYARVPGLKEKFKEGNGKSYIYASRDEISEDLVYQSNLESKLGIVGDLIARVKAKVSKDNRRDEAYLDFLGKNGFRCEQNPYHFPVCEMRSYNLIADELLEENVFDMVQVFDKVVYNNFSQMPTDDMEQ